MSIIIRVLSAIAVVAAVLPFAASAQPRQASVFVQPVSEHAFSQDIEALGTLEPKERVTLSLNAADRVTAIYFDDGQRVTEGTTLLSLAQAEQRALVEAEEANFEEARRQLARVERLARQNAVSESELDSARRNAEAAEAQLRAVQTRMRDRVLIAPFDGVLGFRRVSLGSFVQPGDEVATLIDDREMRLEFPVPSVFLSALSPGVSVSAETSSLPGEVFKGEITSVDNQIDPITRSILVRATLPNDARVLRAGMFMTVTVSANERRALAVPEEAVEPVGPRNFVWMAIKPSDGQGLVASRREVTTGQRGEGLVEIVSGLSANDLIITEGGIRVREGTPLKVETPDLLLPEPASGKRSTSLAGAASAPVDLGDRLAR